ncbi:MAG: AraC family transcriptional regulator [Oscillospiraceae bacterium]|nr:AraC family transcriptional regulator [Oscillospiraceae bacterium]MDD4367390.1 AraC family transcriptional regulator [Oscillospiraceae bacterium]
MAEKHLEAIEHDGIIPVKVVYFRKEGDRLADVVLPHWHQDIEINYLIYGSTIMWAHGAEREISTGEMFLVNSGEVHASYRSEICEEEESLVLLIDYEFIRRYFCDIDNYHFTECFTREQTDYLSCEMNRIAELYSNKNKFYSLEITETILRIVIYLLEHCTDPVYYPIPTKKGLRNIDQAIAYINQKYTQNISLQDLSAFLGLDQEYFSRHFHQVTGISFRDYLQLKRLNAACFQMENVKKTMTDIAYDCGFTSLKSFISVFRKYYKLTPKQYLQQKK